MIIADLFSMGLVRKLNLWVAGKQIASARQSTKHEHMAVITFTDSSVKKLRKDTPIKEGKK